MSDQKWSVLIHIHGSEAFRDEVTDRLADVLEEAEPGGWDMRSRALKAPAKAPVGPRRARRDAVAEYALAHPEETLDDVGERFGCSRQAVDQMLHRAGVAEARQVARKALRDARAGKAAWEELARRAATAKPCAVCGCWVLRGETYLTCSPECAEARQAARWRLSETEAEKQRRRNAESVLRHRERHSDVKVRWAERVLSDNPPPRNRTYHLEGSKATVLLKKAGASA